MIEKRRKALLNYYTKQQPIENPDCFVEQILKAESEFPEQKWCYLGKHLNFRVLFAKRKSSPDGLGVMCKDCYLKYKRDGYLANRKLSYEKNPSHILKQNQKWKDANPEKLKESKRKEFQKNKDKYIVYRAKYRISNIEKIKQASKMKYLQNKEQYKIYRRNRKARIKAASGNFTLEQWQGKLVYFGNKCYLCKVELTPQNIHIEHRIPISKGGTNWIANIAPACSKCNLSKNQKTEKEFREYMLVKSVVL